MPNFPMTGYQHTRAVVALTLAQMCVETFAPDKAADIEAQMDKIKAAIKPCAALTKKKKLSGGAKHDMANCSITAGEYFEAMLAARGDKRLYLWSALLWCAYIFVEDAINTCPQFVEKSKWKKLYASMEELCEALCDIAPRCDEFGTYIYEKCAWALDGVVFKDERELEFAA